MRRGFIPLLWFAFACLLYSNVGQMAALSIAITGVQEEAQATLSSSPLVQLSYTRADISSGRAVRIGSNEIRYEGRLYDIASSRTSGDKTTLQVRWDEKEDDLLSELGEYVENVFEHFPINGKTAKLIFKDSGKDYFPNSTEFTLLTGDDSLIHFTQDEAGHYTSANSDIHIPPPRA